MLFKSLMLKNFRQFKGETNVEFACDSFKNVTVILGNNTFGKTTLLQAFNWCLYEKADFRDNPDFLLNRDLEMAMRDSDVEDVVVAITIMHKGNEYRISRKQEYVCYNGVVIPTDITTLKIYITDLNGKGVPEPVRDTQLVKVINSLIPEDLSGYFFFDTERVNNVSSKKDLSKAVKDLLGMAIYDNALNHLGDKSKKKSVLGTLNEQLSSAGDKKAEEALLNIQDGQLEFDANEERIKTCEEEIEKYKNKKKEIEDILRENASTAKLQKDRDNLENNIKKTESYLNTLRETYLNNFGEKSICVVAEPLVKTADKYLTEVKIDDGEISDITQTSIKELLQRGRCICGCELVKDSNAYRHLIAELNHVRPVAIGSTVRTFKSKLLNFTSRSDKAYETIKKDFTNIKSVKNQLQNMYDDLEDIKAQIQGKSDVLHYEIQLGQVKNKLNELDGDKNKYMSERGRIKNYIETWQKVYDKLTSSLKKNKKVRLYISYAEAVKDWISKDYKAHEAEILEKLQEAINNIFNKMYHGERSVIIDEKFNTRLMANVDGVYIETGESEGLIRVKNFAFIAGLETLAKEKLKTKALAKGAFNLTTDPYPLVMDAPFSNADEEHIKNISKILPEVAEQVIMFVMQKDWKYAEPVLKTKIGKKYQLDKHSETYTELV